MEATGKPEVVHTFGWYMRKYARDVKAKGATPIILSHIPRNNFVTKDSLQIVRNDKGHALRVVCAHGGALRVNAAAHHVDLALVLPHENDRGA